MPVLGTLEQQVVERVRDLGVLAVVCNHKGAGAVSKGNTPALVRWAGHMRSSPSGAQASGKW